jgi:hypothetical protein
LVVAEEGIRRTTLNIFIAPVGDVERGSVEKDGLPNASYVPKYQAYTKIEA